MSSQKKDPRNKKKEASLTTMKPSTTSSTTPSTTSSTTTTKSETDNSSQESHHTEHGKKEESPSTIATTESQQTSSTLSTNVPEIIRQRLASQIPSIRKFMKDYKSDVLSKFYTVVVPRPLFNPSNNCYANVVLQCLLANGTLNFVVKKLVPYVADPEVQRSQYLRDILHLYADFRIDTPPQQGPNKAHALLPLFDPPVNPYSYYLPGSRIYNEFLVTKCQQDAQEFLIYMLNGLHEDLLTVMPAKPVSLPLSDDAEWEQAGPNRKSSLIITATDFPSSPITDIFGGVFKSTFKKQGMKASSSFEPFFTMPLDISRADVQSVETSLKYFSNEEIVEDSSSSVVGKKSLEIEKLPRCLILQLKRFLWDAKGERKLTKAIHYPEFLPAKIFNCPASKLTTQRYRLSSVISHHGSTIASGHYTCIVRRGRADDWIRFDDHNATPTSVTDALKQPAYLLFYELV
eukprot:TRINITY_DN2461_c0_g1_i10.p1 TRINITY_DN2461_c0_g1~~TRINITY_DN2461_c0_g1_i10.p1  ORF type:complete len:460 (-),score=88.20 TRINITY_DN2461_c0_g1_i10:288-1667(-)